MKEKFIKIVENTADILYRRGLNLFPPEHQQFLINCCALGYLAELYENEELKKTAQNAFTKLWFHGKKTDLPISPIYVPASTNKVSPKSRYLIFLFFGIGMKEGNDKMDAFAEKLRLVLLGRNPENDVIIKKYASFDDSDTKNIIDDGLISDAVQVVLRAYLPVGKVIKKYISEIEKMCYEHPDSKVILIGYSGGGVMVSKIYEELTKKGTCVPQKVIRIGSPELSAKKEDALKTVNIIIPGDPVPVVSFMRNNAGFRADSHFLLNVGYDTVNPISIHGLYFSSTENGNLKNYEQTALACAEYIK